MTPFPSCSMILSLALTPVLVAHAGIAEPDQLIEQFLIASAQTLDSHFTACERDFSTNLSPWVTVELIVAKKRKALLESEFDKFYADQFFRNYVNARFRIVHYDEFVRASIASAYYYHINSKQLSIADCLDQAARLTKTSRKR